MLKNRLCLSKDFFFKKCFLKGVPFEILIEITNKCNLRCIMCGRTKNPPPSEGNVNFFLFQRILEENRDYLELVLLHGLGEPLLNPNIFKMIQLCHKLRVRTELSTNATVLSEEVCLRLLNSGLDAIIFSLDAASKQTYEKLRKGAVYEKTLHNTKLFLEKKKYLDSKIFCVAQMVILPENRKEIKSFNKMWKAFGVNAVRFKRDEVIGVNNNRQLKRKLCHFLWSGPFYVRYDGEVFPCCWSYNYNETSLGNLSTHSLKELWNGERMVWMRKMHRQERGNEIPACASCLAPQPNIILVLGSFILGAFRIRTMIPFFEKLTNL